METCVELKTCEACGTIFTRPNAEQNPYCAHCTAVLKDFPSVESRKRRGRPARKHLAEKIEGHGICIRMEVDE